MSLLNPLVLGSAVLKPDLDLCLGQPEGLCELEATTPRDVLCAVELQLQAQGLLAGERGALSTRTSLLAASPCHCKHNILSDIITI